MTRRLFVGNLTFTTTAQALGTLFEKAGNVQNATIVSRHNQSLGYGFVEMSTLQEAQKAAEVMKGAELDGRILVVETAFTADQRKEIKKNKILLGIPVPTKPKKKLKPHQRRRAGPDAPLSDTRCYIANIPFACDEEQEIIQAFQQFGLQPTEVVIAKKPGGAVIGHGFVSFATHEEQQQACALDGVLLIRGRDIDIEPARMPVL